MIPMLLIITFIIYWLLDLTPGDPVSYLMDPEALARLTAEQVAALRAQYGLDDPFFVRYFKWLGRLLTGDFGYSSSSGVPVIQIMAERLPATLELAVAALCISTVLGSVLGVLGAIYKGNHRRQRSDRSRYDRRIYSSVLLRCLCNLNLRIKFRLAAGWRPNGSDRGQFCRANQVSRYAGSRSGNLHDGRCHALRPKQHAGYHEQGLHKDGPKQRAL